MLHESVAYRALVAFGAVGVLLVSVTELADGPRWLSVIGGVLAVAWLVAFGIEVIERRNKRPG